MTFVAVSVALLVVVVGRVRDSRPPRERCRAGGGAARRVNREQASETQRHRGMF